MMCSVADEGIVWGSSSRGLLQRLNKVSQEVRLCCRDCSREIGTLQLLGLCSISSGACVQQQMCQTELSIPWLTTSNHRGLTCRDTWYSSRLTIVCWSACQASTLCQHILHLQVRSLSLHNCGSKLPVFYSRNCADLKRIQGIGTGLEHGFGDCYRVKGLMKRLQLVQGS